MKAKILILLDYIRQEYVTLSNGNAVVNYGHSKSGRAFKAALLRVGLREGTDYEFDFVYNKVPEPDRVDNYGRARTYILPDVNQLKEWNERLAQKIIRDKPKLIIPTSRFGVKFTHGTVDLSKAMGYPRKAEIHSAKLNETEAFWALPIYSQEYINVNKQADEWRQSQLNLLGRYVKHGESIFKPKLGTYTYPRTLADVDAAFDAAEADTKSIVAWDLETSSLSAELKGAKPLVVSLSWRDRQAVMIPLEHSDHETFDWAGWTPEELDHIYARLKHLVESKQPKVLHNGKFDVHYLMGTGHISQANNCLDTLIGYYLTVNQGVKNSLRLTDLAFSTTDMGGYDTPLEKYKPWFLTKVIGSASKLLTKRIGTGENKQPDYQLTEEDIPDLVDLIDWQTTDTYQYVDKPSKEWLAEFKETKVLPKTIDWIVKLAMKLINQYRKKTEVINWVDGSNFCYDWIPLSIMGTYSAGDSDCCRRVYDVINEMVDTYADDSEHKLRFLWKTFYPKLTNALASVEHEGLQMDLDYTKKIEQVYTEEEHRLAAKLSELTPVKQIEARKMKEWQLGVAEFAKPKAERDPVLEKYRTKYRVPGGGSDTSFKYSASADKKELLFKVMGWELPKDKLYLTGTGEKKLRRHQPLIWSDYSTDKNALAYIADNATDEIDKKVITYLQEIAKTATLKSGFTTKLLKLLSNTDGHLHPHFNMSGTQTSRLSSTAPKHRWAQDNIYRELTGNSLSLVY